MKILVVEDQQLIRDMLTLTCGSVFPGSDVRSASTGAEGVALCSKFKPNVILLDLALPDGDGLDLLPDLNRAAPKAKIVVLTSHADEFTVHRAVHANVQGFVDKNEPPLGMLKEAIATVMDGRQYLSPAARRIRLAMRDDPNDFSKILSDREQELLGLYGEGLENDEIAKKLGLSVSTIKLQRVKIMNKLDIHGTPKLMRYAIDHGFTRPKRTG